MRTQPLVLACALGLSGCIELTGFACRDDVECDLDGREGVCEAAGACSYPDDDCLTGRRFEARAPQDASECVPLFVDCDLYCDIFARKCDESAVTYTDRDACLENCAQFPEGTIDDEEGDTLGCRLNQLRNVDDWSTERNCALASRTGGEVCREPDAPTPQLYCNDWVTLCNMLPGGVGVDVATCNAVAAQFYPGEIAEDQRDTLGCRIGRLMRVMLEAPGIPEPEFPAFLMLGCLESSPTPDNPYCELGD